MEVNQHRTWAEIDLGAIEHNYRVICEQAQAPVMCVVKADAYGLVPCRWLSGWRRWTHRILR